MNKAFYSRLALTNLLKNKSTYFPYLLSGAVVTAMFYIVSSLQSSAQEATFYQSDNMANILRLGQWVVGLFSALLLFYTNGFLIKRRKKELGLYSILGMEKRHIGRVLFWETFLIGAAGLLIGIGGGILLSKLVFLLLINLTGISVGISFSVPVSAILLTLGLFLVIFCVTFLNNLRQIHTADPISLLQGSRQGEREPKTRWLLAVAGILCLGGGYILTLTTNNPYEALSSFFIGVLLVIVGTFALFIAGSIAVLKMLRKRKRFYYNPRNFISVSGMLYRMKQNAAGLASICILSTVFLVILSSTVSLYIGQQNILSGRFPRQIVARMPYSEEVTDKAQAALDETCAAHGIQSQNPLFYTSVAFAAQREGAFLNTDPVEPVIPSNFYGATLIPLSDFNRVTGSTLTLNPGEVSIHSTMQAWPEATVRLGSQTFSIRDSLPEAPNFNGALASQQLVVIVPDLNTIFQLAKELPKELSSLSYSCQFDVGAVDESLIGFATSLSNNLGTAGIQEAQVDNVYAEQQQFLNTFGSLFFIGLFLGMLFLLATVLIIYYKQVTEGYEDRERFEIMQKVGLSRHEVKKTIHKQILMVFFLPLVMAVIHVAVAYHIVALLLMAFGLTDTMLFFFCTAGTILVFGLVYAFVYAMTSRVYYRLVQRRA